MSYTIIQPSPTGIMPIANIDAGYLPPNGSTVVPSLPMYPGMRVQAQDPNYGMGEFILLKGVASTAIGSMVVYDGNTYATTLTPVTAGQARPVAFAMSANTDPAEWGWYQIAGTCVAVKSAVSINPKVAFGVSSIGKIGAVASGKEVLGARTANAATVASATSTITVVVDRPHLQGQVV